MANRIRAAANPQRPWLGGSLTLPPESAFDVRPQAVQEERAVGERLIVANAPNLMPVYDNRNAVVVTAVHVVAPEVALSISVVGPDDPVVLDDRIELTVEIGGQPLENFCRPS